MQRIGKYVIHKAAASTGYARIYFCQDPDLQVPVAIKLFDPRRGEGGPLSAAQWLTRFQVEARVLATFDHPYIIGIKGMELLGDGRPYFVMPFQPANLAWEIGRDLFDPAKAADLAERDRPRRLPLPRVLGIMKQLSSALTSLHRRGLVHRSVQPSNVLLSAKENGQVRLCDFSTVKLPERNPPFPDHWIGATDYCAPEQRENATAVTAAADVYALGIMAYRLLTGRLPAAEEAPARLPAEMPAAMAELVESATDPDPTRRPAHAGAFLQGLDKIDPASATRPAVTVVPARRPVPAAAG